jgi:hypothetical protein
LNPVTLNSRRVRWRPRTCRLSWQDFHIKGSGTRHLSCDFEVRFRHVAIPCRYLRRSALWTGIARSPFRHHDRGIWGCPGECAYRGPTKDHRITKS